jgi:hypothetical protein
MGRGIGPEGQMEFLGGIAKVIEDDTGLNASDLAVRIDLQNSGHVLGKIEDHGDIAALASQGSAAATRKNGRAEFPRDGNRSDNVVSIARKDNPYGDLAIIRTVGGIEGATAVVEADFTADRALQSGLQSNRVHGRRLGGSGDFYEMIGH